MILAPPGSTLTDMPVPYATVFRSGPVSGIVPAIWHWPERRAMHALGEPTMWDAGQRLMQTAAHEGCALIVAASPLVDGNREAVQKCREQADKAKKPVRCTIEVRPDGGR